MSLNTKDLAFGGILTAAAVFFQIVPAIFSEIFILMTICSTFPIYIAARYNPQMGITALIAAAFLIVLINMHEALFFICTNGMIGVSLGICLHKNKKPIVAVLVTGTALTVTLSFISFVVGIPMFGVLVPEMLVLQVGFLFVFSVLYSSVFSFIAQFVYHWIMTAIQFY